MLKISRALRFGGTLLSVLLAGRAQGDSQVQLTVEGKKTVLPYVTAARYVDATGSGEIRLLFSTVKPEGVVMADAFGGDTIGPWQVGWRRRLVFGSNPT